MSQHALTSDSDAAASRIDVIKATKDPIPNSYFVMLKPTTNLANHLSSMRTQLHVHYANTQHTYQVTNTYNPALINGYSATINQSALEVLQRHHEVQAIYEDVKVEADNLDNEVITNSEPDGAPPVITRTSAPWGLQRISRETALPPQSDPSILAYEYRHFEPTLRIVDVYVLDTGVMIDHVEFGGRAVWGKNFTDEEDTDTIGHGTHVAGIIAGSQVGVAGTARIIAVKMLGREAWAEATKVMKAIEWAFHQAMQSGNPSIINASLRAEPFEPLDIVANVVVDGGMHFCASAGNKNLDADTQSPGRARNVVTVGATTIDDSRLWFSNFGPKVDIFAPGGDIISTWIKPKDGLLSMSGTSMAAPHVAGVIAYFLSLGAELTPLEMKELLKELGISGILTGIPEGTTNRMMWNGVDPEYRTTKLLPFLQEQHFLRA